MEKVIPASVIKKIQNNTRMIFTNAEIEHDANEARKKIGIPEDFFSLYFPKEKDVVEVEGIFQLCGHLLACWLDKDRELTNHIYEGIDEFIGGEELGNLCIKHKINPFVWSQIMLAKVINMSLNAAIIFAPRFAENYLPKIRVEESGEITVRMNELTTLEDIKTVWSSITKAQKKVGKISSFHNVKREFSQLGRNKKAFELRQKGLTYSQIHEQLKKEGFDSPSYDYVSKMLKGYEKAKGGNLKSKL